MAKLTPSRISAQKILGDLRQASRKGDRTALSLALDQMRTLAHSPRYWEKYLALLRNPLARLVDMVVIKQGERIAHQKGWKLPKPAPPAERPRKPRRREPPRRARSRTPAASAQISLFESTWGPPSAPQSPHWRLGTPRRSRGVPRNTPTGSE